MAARTVEARLLITGEDRGASAGVSGAGRNVAVHAFAKPETHVTEDTSREARKFKVTAYIAGDDADGRAMAFVEACSAPGPATLILPMTRPGQVRCTECSTNNEKTGHWSRKCVDVPERLVGHPFRLTGFVEYRTPWTGRFWTVRQPTAEASIP